jgi:hypothetical protein
MPRLFLLPVRKGKRAVLWALLAFAAAQMALWAWLDTHRPEVRDPLYAYRLRSLKARLAESPGSPLVLLLGSSRTKYGLTPAAMHLHTAPGSPPPVVYNFGLNGMGSIRALMYFRRLLADGIRPDWLLVETWPPQWPQENIFEEGRVVDSEDTLHWRDLPLACRYFRGRPSIVAGGLAQCLLPLRRYRSFLLEAISPALLPRHQVEELEKIRRDCDPDTPAGWFQLTWGARTPAEKAEALQRGIAQMKPLVSALHIDPRSDAALRELLGECRDRHIKTALYLMPEHSVARGWYSPQARELTDTYLEGLHHEFGVPVADTRDWLSDSNFTDFCHMWNWAAAPFSERFGREILQPLLDSRQDEPLSHGQ